VTAPNQSVSTVLVGRVPLDAAAKAAPKNPSTPSFWSTPPRPIGSKTRDIYEVRLSSVKPINTVSVDLPQFPYVASFECWDNKASRWIPLPAPNGRPTVITNKISNPARINSQVTQQGRLHPQHSISPTHWQAFALQTKLIQTNRVRIIFTRDVAATPPKDAKGVALDYSLGVQNLRLSQKVRGKNNVPQTPPINLTTQSETFASTIDMFGSPVSFNLRQNLPRHVLTGHLWKSEPQPFSHAVVPFYVDLRDSHGRAQTIDRIYMEPLTSGPTCNVYYSNSVPDADFATHNFPVEFPLAQLHGDYGLSSRGIQFSGVAPGYVEIDNTAIQWDPSRDWNVLMRYSPQFDNTALPDRGVYTIFDFDAISLRYDASLGIFQFATATTVLSATLTSWNVGGQIDIFLIYSATNGLQVFMNEELVATVQGANIISERCSVFRFGAKIVQDGQDPTFGNYTLNYFMLKREKFIDTGQFADFRADPQTFIELPYDPDDTNSNTQNALLRFSPIWQNLGPTPSNLNPTGFRGGVGDKYDDLVWTPVQRNFKLRKGYFDIPPTKARFIKLEFTNLTPQPYDAFAPIQRTVQTFTTTVTDNTKIPGGKFTIPPGSTRTNMVLYSSGLKFSDTSGGGPLNATKTPYVPPSLGVRNDFSATEAYYTNDPQLAAKLTKQNPMLGMQQWHSNALTNVRFTTTTKHQYETVTVLHNTKTAYFVGLKRLKCYRVNYLVEDDTAAYYELFHGKEHLGDAQEWVLYDDEDNKNFYIATPPVDGEFITTSGIFPSTRNVYALQFATVQSSLIQLLTDNEFDQTDYLGNALLWNWAGLGDAHIESSTDLLSDIGSTVKVTRSTPPPTLPPPQPDGGSIVQGPWSTAANRTYEAMIAIYVTWGGILNSVAGHLTTYGDLSGQSGSGVSVIPPPGDNNSTHYIPGGISGTEFISPRSTLGGRVYAAARVIATEALSDKLWLQIITADGTVVAEDNVEASANGTFEWFVGYEVGTAQSPDDATVLPADTPLSARLIQKTATGDSWYVDNISLFEDPILWEFSSDGGNTFTPAYDVRNNPKGIFVFPTPGKQLQWRVTGFYPNSTVSALEVRPWYEDLLSIILPKPLFQHGPNMQPLDDYPSVDDDPFFQLWSSPIPQDWYISYRLSLFPPQPARGTEQTIWILPARIVQVREFSPPGVVGSTTPGQSQFVIPDAIVLNRGNGSSDIDETITEPM
jgi:hypothetical protein